MRKLIGILIFLYTVYGFPQDSPFIPPKVDNALHNEISGDIAFEDLRLLTQFHRPGGSIGLLRSLQYIEGRAREYGLEDIRLVEQSFGYISCRLRRGDNLWTVVLRKCDIRSSKKVNRGRDPKRDFTF